MPMMREIKFPEPTKEIILIREKLQKFGLGTVSEMIAKTGSFQGIDRNTVEKAIYSLDKKKTLTQRMLREEKDPAKIQVIKKAIESDENELTFFRDIID
ncbi:MAG: hypothetical protein ABH986_04250 [archaeon]